nr:DUF1445 domain-containing protein [Sphaerisporangium perillae]
MVDQARIAPGEARSLFREGLVTPTSGWSSGWTQANLLALPKDHAYDFLLFAQRNPRPARLRRAGRGAPGEVPVFWACGVTPQAAVMRSRPPFAIGHAPGHMAITDVRDSVYLVP